MQKRSLLILKSIFKISCFSWLFCNVNMLKRTFNRACPLTSLDSSLILTAGILHCFYVLRVVCEGCICQGSCYASTFQWSLSFHRKPCGFSWSEAVEGFIACSRVWGVFNAFCHRLGFLWLWSPYTITF